MKLYAQIWKQAAAGKKHTRDDMTLYCLLKAFFARKVNDKEKLAAALLARSFTPITNKHKIVNGRTQNDTLERSMVGVLFALRMEREPIVPKFWGFSNKDLFEKLFSSVEERNEFINFAQRVNNDLKKMVKEYQDRWYTYIFIDQEGVEPIHQAVQAAHVAMVIGKKMYEDHDPHNIFFQIVKKPEGLSIDDLCKDLVRYGYETFVEPDMGNRIVAVGTHPVQATCRGKLRKYQLLSF